VIAQRVFSIQRKNQRGATPFHPDFTMSMVLLKNVILVIFAKVKPPIEPLARPDPTPPTQEPLLALNAHPARTLGLLAPYLAKSVTTMHTNTSPMLRNAFQCKQGSTNRVQRSKSNARPVNRELAATQRVMIVKVDHIKTYPATPRAANAPVDSATTPKVPRRAMVFLLVRTVGMAHFEHVIQVIFVKVRLPIKPRAHLDPTRQKQDPLHASNVHLEHMPTRWAPLIVKTAVVIPTNRHPMLRNAFQCKKGSTNQGQQPKLNARRVKQEAVAMQRAKSVWKEHSKVNQEEPFVTNAPPARHRTK